MNATAAKMNRSAEMGIRWNGLRELDRKNVVANFVAYWPGEAHKGVSSETLRRAILQAEFEPNKPLAPEYQSKNTATWGRTAA